MPAATQAQLEARESCICCGITLPFGEGPCLNCRSPRELTTRFSARRTPPRFVSIVGASGVGKTVYLGVLLDVLNKGTASVKGLANDSISVALQEQTVGALQDWRFPSKTPVETDLRNWVHCEVTSVKNSNNYIDLITPDFAGEAVAMEVDYPGSHPAIRAVLQRSQAIMMLCDSSSVCERGLREDLFATKLASYIYSQRCESLGGTRREKKLDVPLAIVFTKCDCCMEALENPNGFAASNMGRLMRYCRSTFAHCEVFATSVAGSTAMVVDPLGRRSQIPFHIEPHGITEPIEWILSLRTGKR